MEHTHARTHEMEECAHSTRSNSAQVLLDFYLTHSRSLAVPHKQDSNATTTSHVAYVCACVCVSTILKTTPRYARLSFFIQTHDVCDVCIVFLSSASTSAHSNYTSTTTTTKTYRVK